MNISEIEQITENLVGLVSTNIERDQIELIPYCAAIAYELNEYRNKTKTSNRAPTSKKNTSLFRSPKILEKYLRKYV